MTQDTTYQKQNSGTAYKVSYPVQRGSLSGQDSIQSRALAVVYIFITFLGTLSIYGDYPTALKAAYVPFVMAGVLIIGTNYHRDLLAHSISFAKEYLLNVLLLLGITSIIYFIETADSALIKRGYEKIAYQGLTVLIVASAFYLFGKKAIDYTFYGFVLFFAFAIAASLAKYGPASSIESFLYFVRNGGEADGFMKELELHDAVFGFGVFVIYYSITGIRQNLKKLSIAVIFFMLGFKRIGIIAAIVAIIIHRLIRKRPALAAKRSVTIGIVILTLGFLYIVFVRENLFQVVMELFHVDTMGRNELYEFINQYYRISPMYFGRGFEFITGLMKTAELGTFNMAKIGAIHNGYVTIYLELGFIGYFLWNIYWLIWHAKWMKRYGSDAMLAQLAITIYLFITYATDNTAFYFSTCIVARLVPMMFIEQGESQAHRVVLIN